MNLRDSLLLANMLKNETPGPTPPTPVITFKGLCFTAQEAGAIIGSSVTGSPTCNLKYSTDGTNWSTFVDVTNNITNTVTLNNVGDKCYIKGTYAGMDGVNRITFTTTVGKVSISGNLHSILDENNFESITDLTNYGTMTFFRLFENNAYITDASNLQLPATTLIQQCYMYMFYNCSELVLPPSELPATTLIQFCYRYMFQKCVKLTKSPYLKFTTPSGNYCCGQMFYGCSVLNEIKLDYTGNFSGTSFFFNWVRDVQTTAGTFYYNGTDTTRGMNAIPENWTITPFS